MTATFSTVHGATVEGRFFESVCNYAQLQMNVEGHRLSTALIEAAGHLEPDLAAKYREIAETQSFHAGYANCQTGPLLSMGRGQLCQAFLETDATWMVSSDADCAFAPEVPHQMVDLAERLYHEQGLKMLGAPVWIVKFDGHGNIASAAPNVYKVVQAAEGEWLVPVAAGELPENNLCTVGAVGAAFLVLHRELLEKVRDEACGGKPHWWHHLPTPRLPASPEVLAVLEAAAERLQVEPGDLLRDQYGEDTSFCRRVRAVGEQIYIHTGVEIGHAKTVTVYRDTQVYRGAPPPVECIRRS